LKDAFNKPKTKIAEKNFNYENERKSTATT